MKRTGRGLRTYQRQDRGTREHGRAYRFHTVIRGLQGQPREQETRLRRELAAPAVALRISSKRKWYPERGKLKRRRMTEAVLASS